MTYEEISLKADELRTEALHEPDVGYSNYRQVLKDYQQILNDVLVLIRDLADNLAPTADGK